jgi:hypothetical protein
MKYPTPLETLIGAYFHEDWKDDYGDPWSAIDDFARGENQSADEIRDLVAETLQLYPTEAALDQYLFDIGLRYRIEADGWTSHRDWLLAVADRVDSILREKEDGGAG